jgi:hypothetical protein
MKIYLECIKELKDKGAYNGRCFNVGDLGWLDAEISNDNVWMLKLGTPGWCSKQYIYYGKNQGTHPFDNAWRQLSNIEVLLKIHGKKVKVRRLP